MRTQRALADMRHRFHIRRGRDHLRPTDRRLYGPRPRDFLTRAGSRSAVGRAIGRAGSRSAVGRAIGRRRAQILAQAVRIIATTGSFVVGLLHQPSSAIQRALLALRSFCVRLTRRSRRCRSLPPISTSAVTLKRNPRVSSTANSLMFLIPLPYVKLFSLSSGSGRFAVSKRSVMRSSSGSTFYFLASTLKAGCSAFSFSGCLCCEIIGLSEVLAMPGRVLICRPLSLPAVTCGLPIADFLSAS